MKTGKENGGKKLNKVNWYALITFVIFFSYLISTITNRNLFVFAQENFKCSPSYLIIFFLKAGCMLWGSFFFIKNRKGKFRIIFWSTQIFIVVIETFALIVKEVLLFSLGMRCAIQLFLWGLAVIFFLIKKETVFSEKSIALFESQKRENSPKL